MVLTGRTSRMFGRRSSNLITKVTVPEKAYNVVLRRIFDVSPSELPDKLLPLSNNIDTALDIETMVERRPMGILQAFKVWFGARPAVVPTPKPINDEVTFSGNGNGSSLAAQVEMQLPVQVESVGAVPFSQVMEHEGHHNGESQHVESQAMVQEAPAPLMISAPPLVAIHTEVQGNVMPSSVHEKPAPKRTKARKSTTSRRRKTATKAAHAGS